jgi:hypothetical protein
VADPDLTFAQRFLVSLRVLVSLDALRRRSMEGAMELTPLVAWRALLLERARFADCLELGMWNTASPRVSRRRNTRYPYSVFIQFRKEPLMSRRLIFKSLLATLDTACEQ